MKIVTWNVNSIKARLAHVTRWLAERSPDLLLLQELKGENFPTDEIEAAGYRCAVVAQKAYNGVATLVRKDLPIEIVATSLPGDEADAQARFLDISVAGMQVLNIYLPNGNPMDTEKYTYKLAWMDRLHRYASTLRAARTPFLIAGDFNVIPEPIDARTPALWQNDALFSRPAREKFRALKALGLTDALRALTPDAAHLYTFWDYQGGAFDRDEGIRIDHILLSPTLADRLCGAQVDPAPRGWDSPSDHVPVMATLSL